MLTHRQKQQVRSEARDRYASRNGRNARISQEGEVTITIDGNGSQMVHGRDVSGGRIYVGQAEEILREIQPTQ